MDKMTRNGLDDKKQDRVKITRYEIVFVINGDEKDVKELGEMLNITARNRITENRLDSLIINYHVRKIEELNR